MYTFIATSDQHLESALFNLPSLKQDLFDNFSNLVTLAIDKKVDEFISCGDLFDNNKPSSETITFVTNQVNRLKEAKINPIAISGDHSKPINGKSWEKVCGFGTISNISTFIGVDYNDNPAQVLLELKSQIKAKNCNVEFIFLHAQLPELFGFCEDKKRIILPWELIKEKCPRLEGIICGDIHSGVNKMINGIWTGYCGSLGTTRLDEISRRKVIYYDGTKINNYFVDSVRDFYEVIIDDEAVKGNNPEEMKSRLLKSIEGSTQKNKPVVVLRYRSKYAEKLKEFNDLYDIAIVKNTLLKKEQKQELNVNIRSELVNNTSISEVLEGLLRDNNTYSDEVYILGNQLLDSLKDGNTKDILNKIKIEHLGNA